MTFLELKKLKVIIIVGHFPPPSPSSSGIKQRVEQHHHQSYYSLIRANKLQSKRPEQNAVGKKRKVKNTQKSFQVLSLLTTIDIVCATHYVQYPKCNLSTYTWCLKITDKVSFNNASEASYVHNFKKVKILLKSIIYHFEEPTG